MNYLQCAINGATKDPFRILKKYTKKLSFYFTYAIIRLAFSQQLWGRLTVLPAEAA